MTSKQFGRKSFALLAQNLGIDYNRCPVAIPKVRQAGYFSRAKKFSAGQPMSVRGRNHEDD